MYVCKNLLNLYSKDGIWFSIFQAAWKWRIIWEEFFFSIFGDIFWQKLQMFVLKTLKVLILYFAIS